MKLSEQDLEKIACVTLQHYGQNTEDFWQGTRGHTAIGLEGSARFAAMAREYRAPPL